jgi:3-oxoacyl-(acyl-carrier-protein) synthase
LRSAEAPPDQVDYINAHGTGTLLNDLSETRAIKAALGEKAYNVPISSTKSMTGHLMGATAALEAIFCVQAIRTGVLLRQRTSTRRTRSATSTSCHSRLGGRR